MSEEAQRVGAWFMLPAQSSGKVETLSSSDTVILYLHGNSYNRSQPHRWVSRFKYYIKEQ